MKVTANNLEVFQPITVSIVIENPEELKFMRNMSLADISVPMAVSEYELEEYKERTIEVGGQLLRSLYTALKGF